MDFNPVLTEIHGLSPEAKAALGMAGHVVPPVDPGIGVAPVTPGRLLPTDDAAPSPARLSMPGPVPTLSGSPAPSITPPRGTVEGDSNARGTLLNEKPGVETIASKVEGSRLGQAHPLIGKLLGGAAQGAGLVGDTLLHAALPGVEQAIPGTEGHHALELARANNALTEDETNAEKSAQTKNLTATAEHTNAETPTVAPAAASRSALETAQTEHLNAETALAGKPQLEVHDTEDGPILFNKSTGVAQHVTVDGQPVGPKLHLTQSQPIIGPDGKPHTYMLDEKGNKKIDLGEHYERPITVNANAGVTALDRESKQFGTPHQKSVDAANAQLEKIADARTMINGNAESQALGVPKVLTALVSGQGSGVRITQPELNAIAKARGLTGDVEGTLNSWAGKGKLTSTQQKQLTGILDDVQKRITQKQQIASDALDRINGAGTRDEIVNADKEARQKLAEFERGGGESGGSQTFTDAGKTYRIPKDQIADFKKDHPNAR